METAVVSRSLSLEFVRARRTFILNRERAVDYLNMLERLFIFDGFAGWDPEVRPGLLNGNTLHVYIVPSMAKQSKGREG